MRGNIADDYLDELVAIFGAGDGSAFSGEFWLGHNQAVSRPITARNKKSRAKMKKVGTHHGMAEKRNHGRSGDQTQISVAMSKKLLAEIQELADEDQRNRNNWIVHELTKAVAKRKPKKVEGSVPGEGLDIQPGKSSAPHASSGRSRRGSTPDFRLNETRQPAKTKYPKGEE